MHDDDDIAHSCWCKNQPLPRRNTNNHAAITTATVGSRADMLITTREQDAVETMRCSERWNPFTRAKRALRCEFFRSVGLGRLAWIACWWAIMIVTSWLMQVSCSLSKFVHPILLLFCSICIRRFIIVHQQGSGYRVQEEGHSTSTPTPMP